MMTTKLRVFVFLLCSTALFSVWIVDYRGNFFEIYFVRILTQSDGQHTALYDLTQQRTQIPQQKHHLKGKFPGPN